MASKMAFWYPSKFRIRCFIPIAPFRVRGTALLYQISRLPSTGFRPRGDVSTKVYQIVKKSTYYVVKSTCISLRTMIESNLELH